MKIGFIGLGKMGSNMTKRLLLNGHEVVAYDPNEAARSEVAEAGAQVAESREALVLGLEKQIIWLMIPADYVDAELAALLAIVNEGAVIIDGGNSDFRLTMKRAETCKEHGVQYVDVGTSGGVLGLEHGYALMVGGDESTVQNLAPIFTALAPPHGWQRFGKSGSGHYVKMVHNAIEYGVMQAYAEGYHMLKEGPIKDIDLVAVGNVWQQGSIIQSLLNKVATEALQDNPELTGIEGYVHESGETRWTLEIAEQYGIETPVMRDSLDVRVKSQQGAVNFATKLLAAMRTKFGGHALNKGKNNE